MRVLATPSIMSPMTITTFIILNGTIAFGLLAGLAFVMFVAPRRVSLANSGGIVSRCRPQ